MIIEKLEQLLVEAIGAAVEARTYYARLNGTELPINGAVTTQEAPKAKKGRPAKVVAEPMGEDIPVLPPAQPAPAAMTEVDSVKAANEIAAIFVRRFKNQADGLTAARKILTEEFKVARLNDLVHAQRLQFITRLKAEIANGANSTLGL